MIQLTKEENLVCKKISKAAGKLGIPARLIGGFVRDKIIGRDTKDIDIVCEGDGILLAKEVAKHFDPRPQVNFFKNFGTAQIKVNSPDKGTVEIEFVGARKESYRSSSRKPDVSPATFQDDLMRRDFTINTLSVNLDEENFGELIDPLNGLEDLRKGIILTPLDPYQTFVDDPLRMLRAIRFATQLSFSIAGETWQAIEKSADRIRIVSMERITDEMNKIILAPRPSTGFKLLLDSGLLKIIFPEMVKLVGVDVVNGLGHKDNFYHTLEVLDNVSANTDNLWLRWAAILHDIAKPRTKRFEEGTGWTFHGHEVVGGRMVPRIFARFKLPLGEPMKYVRKLVELHLRPISLTNENITDSAVRRLLFDAGDDIDDLMVLCKGDITTKNKRKMHRFLENFEHLEVKLKEVDEADHLRNWQPPITGEMIMKEFDLKPSREVGMIKEAIREAILDGIVPNQFDAAYQYMKETGEKFLSQKVK